MFRQIFDRYCGWPRDAVILFENVKSMYGHSAFPRKEIADAIVSVLPVKVDSQIHADSMDSLESNFVLF